MGHWVTVLNILNDDDSWSVYDSISKKDYSPLKPLFKLLCTNEDCVFLNIQPVSKQKNGYDCGLYALAFSTILASGHDPIEFEIFFYRSLTKISFPI